MKYLVYSINGNFHIEQVYYHQLLELTKLREFKFYRYIETTSQEEAWKLFKLAQAAAKRDTHLQIANMIKESIVQLEKDHLIEVLKAFDFNVTKTCEYLEINRKTYYRWIERYQLDLQEIREQGDLL